jgi:hypothetical protein
VSLLDCAEVADLSTDFGTLPATMAWIAEQGNRLAWEASIDEAVTACLAAIEHEHRPFEAVTSRKDADQGQRGDSSLPQESLRTNCRITAGQSGFCGVSAVIRSQSGAYVLTWFMCDSLHCRHCGPRLRAERAKLYAHAVGRTPVFERAVSRQGWQTWRDKLVRSKADFIRVPTRNGALVLTTYDTGESVGNVIAWLETALGQLVRGPRISTSRRWALVNQHQPSGWTLVGITREAPRSVEQAAAASVGLDDEGRLINADDPVLWDTFRSVVGLHLPARRRKESEPG